MTPMTDVAAFIYKEMMKNLDHAASKKIRALNERSWADVVMPLKQVLEHGEALTIWKSMVGNRRPWDHKPVIKQTFGDWSHDGPSKRRFNFDIWSNLHYGFVGKAVGFSAWELKAGAGGAQWKAGTSPPGYWERRFERLGDADFLAAFDDPADQNAIRLGIELWDRQGRALTQSRLVDAVRTKAADLNTQ